jgi:hypothetical protein
MITLTRIFEWLSVKIPSKTIENINQTKKVNGIRYVQHKDRYLDEKMRVGWRRAVISPTITEDQLEVLVVGQVLHDLQGRLGKGCFPEVGDQVDQAGADQELGQPEWNHLQENPA